MSTIASQITGVSSVYSTVCSGTDRRKHQSSASLVFVRGIHRWPVNSPHKGPVRRKLFPFNDVIIKVMSKIHRVHTTTGHNKAQPGSTLARINWGVCRLSSQPLCLELASRYQIFAGDDCWDLRSEFAARKFGMMSNYCICKTDATTISMVTKVVKACR